MKVGCDSVVCIATRYKLGGLMPESQWGRDFTHIVQTGPGALPASYTMGTMSFSGVKQPGHGVTISPSLHQH